MPEAKDPSPGIIAKHECYVAAGVSGMIQMLAGKEHWTGETSPPEPESAVSPGASWPMPPSFARCSASGPLEATVLALPRGSGKVSKEHECRAPAECPTSLPWPLPCCELAVSLCSDPGSWAESWSCAQHQGKTVCSKWGTQSRRE